MKAIVYENYGPPEALQLKDVEAPVPVDRKMLIRIYAASVNSGDVLLRKADPFAAKLAQ